MNDILGLAAVILLGAFFTGLMFYSFYLVLFSKAKTPTAAPVKKKSVRPESRNQKMNQRDVI